MKRGFTLVELLTVIAIIALLAAILFPVMSRAKQAAKSTACVSNLHQIGESMLLYLADYEDRFPYAVDDADRIHPEQWASFPDFQTQIAHLPVVQVILQPYVKNKELFHCPSDTGSQVLDDSFPLAFAASPSNYLTFGSSYLYRTELTVKQKSQSALAQPSLINVYFDAAGNWHGSTGEALPNDEVPEFIEKLSGFRYNTLFADMHTKGQPSEELQGDWNTPL